MKYFFINGLLFSLIFNLSAFNLLGESRERLFYDAVRAEASGDLEKAIEIYSTIAKESHSANLHANLANLYFKMEDYSRSILHLRKAMWIKPDKHEYLENLNFVLEMNNISPTKILEYKPLFSARHQAHWLVALTVLFWVGMIMCVFFIRRSVKKFQIVLLSTLWLSGLAFFAWGCSLSSENSSNLNREIIVVHSLNGSDMGLPLRVFAGKGSQANTTVPLGSSLFLDLDEDGLVKVHQSPTGEKWFLARSKTGKNKGWLQRSEFEPILDLNL